MRSNSARSMSKFAIVIAISLFAAIPSVSYAQSSDDAPSVLVDQDTESNIERVEDRFRNVFNNTARIKAYGANGQLAWLGSANLVKRENGHLTYLTNSHVVDGADSLTIEPFVDGFSLGEHKATVIVNHMTSTLDIGVLEVKDVIELASVPVIPMVVRDLAVGQEIFRVGHQRGEWGSGRLGHIVNVDDDYILSTPKAIGGDSGSSVMQFNEAGDPEIIALTAWVTTFEGDQVCMSMRIEHVIEVLEFEIGRPEEDRVSPKEDKDGILQRILDRLRDNRIRQEREMEILRRDMDECASDRARLNAKIAEMQDENQELLDFIEEGQEKQQEDAKLFNGYIIQWLQGLTDRSENLEGGQESIGEKLNDSFASVKLIVGFIKMMFWGMVALLIASLFFKQGWATKLIVAIVKFFFKTIKLAYELIHNAIVSKTDNPESPMDAINDIRDGISEEIGFKEDAK